MRRHRPDPILPDLRTVRKSLVVLAADIVCGVAEEVCIGLVTYPLVYLSTRTIGQITLPPSDRLNFFGLIADTLSTRGVTGFYDGFFPYVLTSVTVTAVGITFSLVVARWLTSDFFKGMPKNNNDEASWQHTDEVKAKQKNITSMSQNFFSIAWW